MPKRYAYAGWTRTAALAATLIVALAAALRLPALGLRPVHGDEAVHAYKLNELLIGAGYHYDPFEYHGPTLNYLTLPIAWLQRASDYTQLEIADLRLLPALAGITTVPLVALLADGLGIAATLAATLLMALSPLLTYYSRDYIPEALLGCFTLALIGCFWRASRTRGIGRITWALLAGIAAGLMHATKETSIIALGCAAAAALAVSIWPGTPQPARTRRGGSIDTHIATIVGILAAAGVSVLFYSSFFTNPVGVLDAWRSLAVYANRGVGPGVHAHPWYYYLRTLIYTHDAPGPTWSEALIVIAALVGLIAVVLDKRPPTADRGLWRFVAVLALLMVATYSALPYKTPWSMLSMVSAMCLLGGVGIAALLHAARSTAARGAMLLVLLVAAGQLGWQSYRTSLDPRFVADPRNPYAYAQPLRGVEMLGRFVTQLAAVAGNDDAFRVHVIMPNPWPLPWYLRRLDRVGYWQAPSPDCGAPVVITATDADDLAGCLHGRYAGPFHYSLRPDVSLVAFVQSDLMRRFRDNAPAAPPKAQTDGRRGR